MKTQTNKTNRLSKTQYKHWDTSPRIDAHGWGWFGDNWWSETEAAECVWVVGLLFSHHFVYIFIVYFAADVWLIIIWQWVYTAQYHAKWLVERTSEMTNCVKWDVKP